MKRALFALLCVAATTVAAVTAAIASPWSSGSDLPLAGGYGGHRSTALDHRSMVEYGGVVEDIKASPIARFKTFYGDLRTYRGDQWSLVSASNEPSKRAFHGQAVVDNKVHIIGGFAGFFSVYSDHHICDLDTKECHLVTGDGPYGKRVGVAAGSVGDRVYLFGGNNIDFTQPNPIVTYGDTWEYHDGWSLLNTTGDLPSKRTNAYSFVRDGKFCVFSGEDTIGGGPLKFLDMSIHCLDPVTAVWSRVIGSSNDVRTFVFAACTYNDRGDTLICQGGDYGGCDRDLIDDETTVFSFKERKWIQGILPKILNGPVSKRGTLTLLGNQAIHSGGYATDPNPHQDLVCEVNQSYLNRTYIYDTNNVFAALLSH